MDKERFEPKNRWIRKFWFSP